MPPMSRTSEYADAIAELDAAHAAGRVTDARWEVLRANLLAEASGPNRGGRVLLVVLIVVVAVPVGIFLTLMLMSVVGSLLS